MKNITYPNVELSLTVAFDLHLSQVLRMSLLISLAFYDIIPNSSPLVNK